MKQTIFGPLPENARNFMRRIGYGELRTYSGQISYASSISGGSFPRFHAYVEDTSDGGIQINLHLDQKEQSAEGTAHAGEYEGKLVEEEMGRILRWAAYLKQAKQ